MGGLIRDLGLEGRFGEEDEHGWHKGRSGLSVRPRVLGERLLRFEVRLMPLPSDGDLMLPLLRELNEWGMDDPRPDRLGVLDDHVVFVLHRAMGDVAALRDAVREGLERVEEAAGQLLSRYGGTSRRRGHTPAPTEPGRRPEPTAARPQSNVGLFATYARQRSEDPSASAASSETPEPSPVQDEPAPAAPAPKENIGLFSAFDDRKR